MPVVGLDGEKVGGRAGSYGWETEETPKLDVPVGWFRRQPHTSRPTFLYSTHNKQNEIQTNIKKQLWAILSHVKDNNINTISNDIG